MSLPKQKTTTAQEILDFLFSMLGEKVEITKGYKVIGHRIETSINGELADVSESGYLNGFGLKTTVGSTFEIEIARLTEIAVAWAYFDHCVQYYEKLLKESGRWPAILFARWGFDRKYYKDRLEKVKKWGNDHR